MLVTGSSCVTCLMRIEREIKAVAGVSKAAVSIYKPYAAVIIYDPAKTNLTQIKQSLKGEPVVIKTVHEEDLEKVPAVIAPKVFEGSSQEQKPQSP